MLGAIAGDIIGSRFEGHRGPKRDFALFDERCRFTDDTVCTLAVADALMGEKDFAATLRRFVRRHPHRGYGGMFIDWAMQDAAPAYGSWGNGAPMRVSAVGWLSQSEDDLMADAAAQAAVSHDHPSAIAAAQAVALAIRLAAEGEPPERVAARISTDFGYDLAPETALTGDGFDVSAASTVPPALAAACFSPDFETGLRAAVCFGGDTDTLACITGSVAEALYGMPSVIAETARAYLPHDLEDVLERFEARLGPKAPRTY